MNWWTRYRMETLTNCVLPIASTAIWLGCFIRGYLLIAEETASSAPRFWGFLYILFGVLVFIAGYMASEYLYRRYKDRP